MISNIEGLVARVHSLIRGMEAADDPRAQFVRLAYDTGEAHARSQFGKGIRGALTVLYFVREHPEFHDVFRDLFVESPLEEAGRSQQSLLDLIVSSEYRETYSPFGDEYGQHPVLFLKFIDPLSKPKDVDNSTSVGRTFIESRIPFNYQYLGRFENSETTRGSTRFGYTSDFLDLFLGKDLDMLRMDPMRNFLVRLFDQECVQNPDFTVSQPRQNPQVFMSDYDIVYKRTVGLIRAKLRRDGIIMNPVERYQGRAIIKTHGRPSYPEYSAVLDAFSNISAWVNKYAQKRAKITPSQ